MVAVCLWEVVWMLSLAIGGSHVTLEDWSLPSHSTSFFCSRSHGKLTIQSKFNLSLYKHIWDYLDTNIFGITWECQKSCHPLSWNYTTPFPNVVKKYGSTGSAVGCCWQVSSDPPVFSGFETWHEHRCGAPQGVSQKKRN